MVSGVAEHAVGGRDAPTLADDLRTLYRAFASRRWLIATIIAASLFAAVAYIWLARPVYTSSVDIFIDPRERSIVDLGAAPTGMGSSSQGADNALVESQIAILGSRQVLGELIDRQHLEADPLFNAVSGGILAAVRGWAKALLYGPNAESFSRTTPVDRALAGLSRAVTIKRVGQTYVLNVAVTTSSPERSADIANALADIYLADSQSATDDSARESARSLEARLSQLGAASEASQRAVEDYRKANGLVGSQGVLVDERQLTELSAKVVAASVAKETARVALENLKAGGADAVSSDLAAQIRIRIDQARSEENALAATFGARHPRLAQVRQTRASLEKALSDELGRVVRRAETDYRNAEATETSLKAMLGDFEARLAKSNAASVKLRELEQVAEQNRALYDTFATKAKQAREQISLPTTTARVISRAEPASRPSAPRVAVVLAVGLFLGMVVGFGAAWLAFLLSAPPVRQRPPLTVIGRGRQTIAAE